MKIAMCMGVALLLLGCTSTNGATAGSSSPMADGGTDALAPAADAALDGAVLADGATDAGGGSKGCAEEKKRLLGPVASVSTGAVTATADDAGTAKVLYIDASAGGAQAAATNPRVYVNLSTGAAVAISDEAAATSLEWDLALKRNVVFVNSGDTGPGQGATVFLAGASFDAVTAANATDKTFAKETLFDKYCQAQLDEMGSVRTSFDGWYKYDTTTHGLAPAPGVWLVRSASDKLYKVEFKSYYAAPEGGDATVGGRYRLRVAAL